MKDERGEDEKSIRVRLNVTSNYHIILSEGLVSGEFFQRSLMIGKNIRSQNIESLINAE